MPSCDGSCCGCCCGCCGCTVGRPKGDSLVAALVLCESLDCPPDCEERSRGIDAAKKADCGRPDVGAALSARNGEAEGALSGSWMCHFDARPRMMSTQRPAKWWLVDMACKSCIPCERCAAAWSFGRFKRCIVLAERRRPVTGRHTRRRPHIARSPFIRTEISFAQNVHVSRGYKSAPRKSSLMQGRNKLYSWSATDLSTLDALAIHLLKYAGIVVHM